MQAVAVFLLASMILHVHQSNRSHASSNRVSLIRTRILKICDQRLAHEIDLASLEVEKKSFPGTGH
jgi:hypothetical protein